MMDYHPVQGSKKAPSYFMVRKAELSPDTDNPLGLFSLLEWTQTFPTYLINISKLDKHPARGASIQNQNIVKKHSET